VSLVRVKDPNGWFESYAEYYTAFMNLKRPNHSIRSGQSDDISGVSESVEEQNKSKKSLVLYKREADTFTLRTDLNMNFFNCVVALRVCFDMLSMQKLKIKSFMNSGKPWLLCLFLLLLNCLKIERWTPDEN